MKTPKKYTEMVKNRTLTKEMLGECIYSVNKRAKNHRDKVSEYANNHYFNTAHFMSAEE